MKERSQAVINSEILDVCKELLPGHTMEVATDVQQLSIAHLELYLQKFISIDRVEWMRLKDRDHLKNLVRARLLYALSVMRDGLMVKE